MKCTLGGYRAGVALALLTAGCDGEQWIVAEQAAAGRPGIDASLGCAAADDLLAGRRTAFGSSQVSERHVGRWRGRLSGSAAGGFPAEQVELTLTQDHTGTLLFAGVTPPPAPESALEGDLCDGEVSGDICGTPSGFVGGFAYELLGIGARGAVISFVVIDADPWGPWCELQAPVETVDSAAACGHTFSVRPVAARRSETGCAELLADGTERALDCALMYAMERCQCGYDRCFSSFETGIEVGMSLSDDGEELRGSLWFKDNLDAALLTLRRQP